MKIEIKNRFTDAILFSCEVADNDPQPMKTAVLAAIAARAYLEGAYLARADLAGAYLARADLAGAYLARADLAGANLAGANLAGANLADANLAGAYLAGANLAGANLADANLAGAYLAGANLAGADLAGAYLVGADLAGAYLAGANLARAYLAGANLADANLAGAYLAGADLAGAYLVGARNLPAGTEAKDPPAPYVRPAMSAGRKERLAAHAARFREHNPDVPVIEKLDKQILDVVTNGTGVLKMDDWHNGDACGTTHCRAGWAIFFAGEKGKEMEAKLGPESAGAMIYRASTGRVPNFFASNERALEDIKLCAEEQE